MRSERVAIIGSGAVGGLLGLYLSRLGYSVTVFDQNKRLSLGANQVASVAHFTGSEYPCDADSAMTGKDCILGGVAMKLTLPDFIYGTHHADPSHARFFLHRDADANALLPLAHFQAHANAMSEYYLHVAQEIAERRGVRLSQVTECLHGDASDFITPIDMATCDDASGMIAGHRAVASTLRAPAFASMIAEQLSCHSVDIVAGEKVTEIRPQNDAFEIICDSSQTHVADQIILASGYENTRLARSSGVETRQAATVHLNLATYVTVPNHIEPRLVFTMIDKYGGMCCPVNCHLETDRWLAMLYWPSSRGSQIASCRFHDDHFETPDDWHRWLKEDHPDRQVRGMEILSHLQSLYPFLSEAQLHHVAVRTVLNPWGPVREVRRFSQPAKIREYIHSVFATKFTHVVLTALEAVIAVQRESILHGRLSASQLAFPTGIDLSSVPQVFNLRSLRENQQLTADYAREMRLT